MQFKCTILIAGMAAIAALLSPASATIAASATTPLNLRSGPGPQYSIIDAVADGGQAEVIGCIQGSLWCQVSYNGTQGWAYSEYLTARLAGQSFAVAETLKEMPTVTYQAPVETVGSAESSPAVIGTLVARPATAQPVAVTPPANVRSYVISHPVKPVYLNGEVVEGVGLPGNVTLVPIPGYDDYEYANVNNVPVLVEPATRQVAFIFR
jgi:uncharacterized protein YraI